MTDRVDRELLAERAAAVVRHLDRVAEHLPADPGRAAGFRNLVVHGYGRLDLRRVHAIASAGPADLRAFLAALRDHADPESATGER
jgi:uncharacterized protein with HEPN domain